jgi:hypothetical protein
LYLKQTIAANKLYRSVAELRQQVLLLFAKQNDVLGSERLLFHRFLR